MWMNAQLEMEGVDRSVPTVMVVLAAVATVATHWLVMGAHVSRTPFSVEGHSQQTVAVSRPPTGHRTTISILSVNGLYSYREQAKPSCSLLTPQLMDSQISLQLHVWGIGSSSLMELGTVLHPSVDSVIRLFLHRWPQHPMRPESSSSLGQSMAPSVLVLK